MPIFEVEITTVSVVEAENEYHARQVARQYLYEATNDSEPKITVRGEVKSTDDLRDGWDGECLPYGGDGNTRLNAILPPNARHKPTASEFGLNELLDLNLRRKKMKATIQVELQPFTVPNSVRPVEKPGKREDGFAETVAYPLSDLDSLTLDRLCEQFRNEVFRKAGKEQPPSAG